MKALAKVKQEAYLRYINNQIPGKRNHYILTRNYTVNTEIRNIKRNYWEKFTCEWSMTYHIRNTKNIRKHKKLMSPIGKLILKNCTQISPKIKAKKNEEASEETEKPPIIPEKVTRLNSISNELLKYGDHKLMIDT